MPERPDPSEFHKPLTTPDMFIERVNKLPKWARDYIHQVHTFVGAPEVQELTYLRDQNQQLIRLVADLKRENVKLRRRLEKG